MFMGLLRSCPGLPWLGSELDVQPVNALQVILLLLQLEHMPHEELLQVLIGKVDAELPKLQGQGRGQGAAGRGGGCSGPALPLRGDPSLMFSVCPWDFQSPTSSMTEEGMKAQLGTGLTQGH